MIEIIVIITCLILISITIKKKYYVELIIASTIAIIWVKTSGIYNYTTVNYNIIGINLLPLTAWITGLTITGIIYKFLKNKNKGYDIKSRKIISIGITYCMYIGVLFSLEAVFYNILKIQLNNNLTGIFGLPIIHVPLFAKIWYMTAPITYIIIIEIITKQIEMIENEGRIVFKSKH